jgi:DNA-binding response OmpR family regulator
MASVLVVDDEDDIRELLRINLELDGHVVSTARNGHEALARVAEQVPDVMVLDVMMPGMDGWEVLARMKSQGHADAASVPVLMLTARTDDMDRLRGGIEGAIRYLTKPFSLTELRTEVRRALEGEPEPVKRRKVQHGALEQLARLERGSAPAPGAGARPRLTKLDGAPEAKPGLYRTPRLSAAAVETLSPKQLELLHMVAATPTVREAAERLGVSRSNVYASLRRIARKLDVGSVAELVGVARQGGLPDAGD